MFPFLTDCANMWKMRITRCGTSPAHTCTFTMCSCRVRHQMSPPTFHPRHCAHSAHIANWRPIFCVNQQPISENNKQNSYHWPFLIRTNECIIKNERVHRTIVCIVSYPDKEYINLSLFYRNFAWTIRKIRKNFFIKKNEQTKWINNEDQ